MALNDRECTMKEKRMCLACGCNIISGLYCWRHEIG